MPRPCGLLRLLLRAPVLLYRLRLGWLLGERVLLLTHTGRRSGLRRDTPLEVVRHDPATGAYYVVAAWGRESDWLRNVLQTPRVRVTVGRRRFDATASPLPPGEAERELRDYARRHPTAMRVIAERVGCRLNGVGEDYRALAEKVAVVALRPEGRPAVG